MTAIGAVVIVADSRALPAVLRAVVFVFVVAAVVVLLGVVIVVVVVQSCSHTADSRALASEKGLQLGPPKMRNPKRAKHGNRSLRTLPLLGWTSI